MIKKLVGAICVVVFAIGICSAQSHASQSVANLGESVQGVQMSIALTNNVFRVGQSATVAVVTGNFSTNDITVETGPPSAGFDAVLTSGTGKSYHVIELMPIYHLTPDLETIEHGRERFVSIGVIFKGTFDVEPVEPGDYTLVFKRSFILGKCTLEEFLKSNSIPRFVLESNPIKVRIMK